MRNFKTSIYILFWLTTIPDLTAQKGYVVNLQYDTLPGFLSLISTKDIDRVELIAGNEKTSFTALQVKALMMEGTIYHPIRYASKFQFMQLLRPGFLSLYAFKIENQTTLSGRLLIKAGGDMLDIPGIRFRSIVANFLKECAPVSEKIRAGILRRENLEQLVDEYNLCKEETNTVQEKQMEKILDRDQKINLINEFKNQVMRSSHKRKEEVTGLLDDIRLKIENEQPVPKYQLEALKEYLAGEQALKEKLPDLLKAIAPN